MDGIGWLEGAHIWAVIAAIIFTLVLPVLAIAHIIFKWRRMSWPIAWVVLIVATYPLVLTYGLEPPAFVSMLIAFVHFVYFYGWENRKRERAT